MFHNAAVLLPLHSKKSNLKAANENLNIIRAILKNIIDLFVVVWVDIKPTFKSLTDVESH